LVIGNLLFNTASMQLEHGRTRISLMPDAYASG